MKYDVKSLTKSIIEISEGVGSDIHYVVNLKSIENIEMFTNSSNHTRVYIRMVGNALRFDCETKQEAMFLYNDITATMVLMEDGDKYKSQVNDLPEELDESYLRH
jgi:hypothetical protein